MWQNMHNYGVSAVWFHQNTRLTEVTHSSGHMRRLLHNMMTHSRKSGSVKTNRVQHSHPSEVHLTFSASFVNAPHLIHIRSMCKQTPRSAGIMWEKQQQKSKTNSGQISSMCFATSLPRSETRPQKAALNSGLCPSGSVWERSRIMSREFTASEWAILHVEDSNLER